ncbi:MAG: fructose-bisphosphatase class III [Lachnospiraceae bacterium]|nr:fructose-bisphosphatase class III [Lachnospiraceae bacterium]
MSNYVISDIHGQYKSYKRMLRAIQLQPEDTLYVLGDVIDRGPDGIKILNDMMKRENVIMFMGNHELMMLDALKNLQEYRSHDREDTDDLDLWLDPCNGGKRTFEAFQELSPAKKKQIIQYLESSYVIKRITINKKKYHLSHAYICDKKGDSIKYSDVRHRQVWDSVWINIYDRAFLSKNEAHIFPNKKTIYIAGHTFTQRLDCMDELGRGVVYHNDNYHGYHVYNIDCGMALKNKSSQLGCLRIEDGMEFYVPLEENNILK